MESNSSLCGKLLANEQRKLVCFCIQVTVNLRVVQAQQKMDEEAIAAEIAQTAGDEKSKDTADALTALVAN